MKLTPRLIYSEFTDDAIFYCTDNKNDMQVRFRYM